MKKLYSLKEIRLLSLLFLCLLGYSFANAQVVTYGFSQSVGTYTPITGGTVYGNTTTDDQRFVDPAVPLGGTVTTGAGIPIGFDFTFKGNIFDRLAINANGWISFGKAALTPSVNNASTSAYTPLASVAATTPIEFRSRIAGIGRDIQAQAGAEIRLQTIGTAPNRVCVIQWTNYKKFGGGGTGDNLNFQIRLNETTNVVDVVYGTIVFNATSNTADVGLGGSVATDFNNRTTTTDWNATTAGTLNTSRLTMLNTVTAPVPGRTFTWTPPVPCTGAPNPGNTLATANPACSGVAFTLSLQNNPAVSGLTYQWQSSPDGVTWTNIAGATNATYTTSQTVATYYRANVTCTGVTTASSALQVTMNTPVNCYCIPPATNCNLDDVILNVTFAGINNSSTCSANGYNNYSATIGATVIAGTTNPMTVQVGPGGTEHVGVWIDYNKDGIFQTTEFSVLGSGNGVTIAGSITIPANAQLGTTRMRIRVRFNTPNTGADACLGYAFGETEDYAITINPCIQGVFTTQPTSGSITCAGTRTFTVAGTGSGLSFTWQQRVTPTSPWTTVTNGGVFTGATTTSLTLTNVPSSYSGYQYRAVMDGPCTATEFSTPATLTVTPLTAQVVPTSATICAGTIQALNIINPGGFGPVTTQTFSSGPIAVPIPDNTPAGGNSTIVSTTPLGASVSAISVRFTMAHTYSGDVAIVLRAPNGQILNLDYFISGTGAAGTGFINTVISSQTTPVLPLLSSSASPYTGTFRPDAVLTGAPAPGPTGFAPTTTSFAALFSQANGNWTLAAYDAFNLDAGVLTSWSIDITYRPIAPLSGTWTSSPATPNTMFTDAAATIPYVAGTPVTGIYVNPSTQGVTNYTVSVISPTCTIAPLTIPVTVNTPVGTVPAPVNSAVCENGNTTFTVAPTSGGAFTYQWQVSTDGGGTWANIANGNIYNGVTTATLSITGAPLSWNNYQYRAVVTVPSCNSANSGAATLTVNQLPDVVINAGPYTNLYPGITTTLTAAVSPNAAATYQWYKNGQPVPGATNATLVVDVDNLGDYYVSVNDVNGCGNISNTITIGSAPNDIMFIYPSPTTGQFQVRYYNTPGNAVARTLTIYDSKGSRVFYRTYNVNTPYNQMDVDLKHHGHGIYRVELGDLNGKRIKTGSVLVL